MKNKSYAAILFIFLSAFSFGQWHQIVLPSPYYTGTGYGRSVSISSNNHIFMEWGVLTPNHGGELEYGIIATNDDFNSQYDINFHQSIYQPSNLKVVALNDSTVQAIVNSQLVWGTKTSMHAVDNIASTEFFPIKAHTYQVDYVYVANAGYTANISLADTSTHTTALKSSITNTTDYLSDIFFTDDSTGYFLNRYYNGNSFIKKTIDFGATWVDALTCSDTLQALHFPTPNVGYAVGDSGMVFKTVDAGTTWNNVNLPVKNNLSAINFINPNTGYVAGDKGVLYKTINGGVTWNAEISNDTNQIIMVKMVDDSTAYFYDGNKLFKNNYTNTTAIENLTQQNNSNIYPNPNNGSFVIQPTETSTQTLNMYDVNGNLVLNQTINGTTTINATILNEGVYTVCVTGNKSTSTKKIIIIK